MNHCPEQGSCQRQLMYCIVPLSCTIFESETRASFSFSDIYSKFTTWCARRGASASEVYISDALCGDPESLKALQSIPSHQVRRLFIEDSKDGDISERQLLQIAPLGRNAEELELYTNWATKGDKMRWETRLDGLARACPRVRSLYIMNLNQPVWPFAVDLSLFDNLQRLTIDEWEMYLAHGAVTDTLLQAVGTNCHRLHTLRCFWDARNHLCACSVGIGRMHSQFTELGVRAVLRGCPLLRETDMYDARSLSPTLLVEIAERCNFAQIDLRRWDSLVTDALVQGVLRVSPALRDLALPHWSPVTDATLAVCAQCCPLLESLVLTGCRQITDAGLLQLTRPGNRLRSIRLADNAELTEEVVLAIAHHCSLLECLTWFESELSAGTVLALAQGCLLLRELSLYGKWISDAVVEVVARHCPQLQRLSLDTNWAQGVTMASIGAIAEHCTRLQALCLPEDCYGQLPRFRSNLLQWHTDTTDRVSVVATKERVTGNDTCYVRYYLC